MTDILPPCWAPLFRDPYTFDGLRWGISLNRMRKNVTRADYLVPPGTSRGFPAPGATGERRLAFSRCMDGYILAGVGTFTPDRLTDVGIQITCQSEGAVDLEVLYTAIGRILLNVRGAAAIDGEDETSPGVFAAQWPSDPRGELAMMLHQSRGKIHLLYAEAPAVAREVAWYD
ncbi:MAG: hypothetical protein ACR2M1_13350 [Gemmatimonadaceae bacterium]